jgi:two-component system NtrC family sensor kinase
MGLGASKTAAKAILHNVNYAFFTVAGAIIVLLIVLSLIISKILMKPLYDVLNALEKSDFQNTRVQLPATQNTELGLLTDSFNEMSGRIFEAQSALKSKIAELEKANLEIRDTQARLVHTAKMASLGQLVAGIAHELNNPIGFIYSNMSHLRDYAEKLMDLVKTAEKSGVDLSAMKEKIDFDYVQKDLPRLIQSCEDGARRTRDIVVGLRNFSRLEEAQIKEVDIHESLDTTLQLLTGELKNRIKVVKKYSSLPPITCYPSQLNQVFMNILSNAAQAIEGEGEIRIETKKSGKNRILISIHDSGVGMSKSTVEKIFDPFFTTKGLGQGTGLGLSISYGIIQNHGGEIRVESEPGKGTEFIIELPIKLPA